MTQRYKLKQTETVQAIQYKPGHRTEFNHEIDKIKESGLNISVRMVSFKGQEDDFNLWSVTLPVINKARIVYPYYYVVIADDGTVEVLSPEAFENKYEPDRPKMAPWPYDNPPITIPRTTVDKVTKPYTSSNVITPVTYPKWW